MKLGIKIAADRSYSLHFLPLFKDLRLKLYLRRCLVRFLLEFELVDCSFSPWKDAADEPTASPAILRFLCAGSGGMTLGMSVSIAETVATMETFSFS